MLEVSFSQDFLKKFKNFPTKDKEIISAFVTHISHYGFTGLKGRNKSSTDVPKEDPNFLKKVNYAKEHNLWHYHIGIPKYTLSTLGDYVSEYVIQYSLVGNEVKILSLDPHPPLKLPPESYFF